MGKKIYRIRQSHESNRPDYVTYYDPQDRFVEGKGLEELQKNLSIASGDPGFDIDEWFVPTLFAPKKGSTPIDAWDFYNCNTFGAFSPRAITVLTPFFGERFGFLPATLEGHEFKNLCCRSRVDCLDPKASRVNKGVTIILDIDKHVFKKGKIPDDPAIFSIPQLSFALYCTASIPKIVKNEGLRGFKFEVIDDA